MEGRGGAGGRDAGMGGKGGAGDGDGARHAGMGGRGRVGAGAGNRDAGMEGRGGAVSGGRDSGVGGRGGSGAGGPDAGMEGRGGGGAGALAARPENPSGPGGSGGGGRRRGRHAKMEGTGSAGAAPPENSSGPGGFLPAALPEFPIPLRTGRRRGRGAEIEGTSIAGAARLENSSDQGGFLPGALLWLPIPLGAALSDTTATSTSLEESTLRMASVLNLRGEEPPPAVERPSIPKTTLPRKRTPGRWRRIPRLFWSPPPFTPAVKAKMDEGNLIMLENIEFIESMCEEDCDLETEQDRAEFHAFQKKMSRSLRLLVNSKPETTVLECIKFTDTEEEHLTAEGMEAQVLAQFPDGQPCKQAQNFAEIALAHYNEKKMHKFELATTLLSKCFSESCGTTYGHVNFTATQKTAAQPAKRLFFAEVMLIPELQAYADAQPMRVVHVCTIDDDACYGGCHKIFRKINHTMRHNMDYERCHACSDRIKHPKGQLFDGGHNSTRMPYYSAI